MPHILKRLNNKIGGHKLIETNEFWWVVGWLGGWVGECPLNWSEGTTIRSPKMLF